MDLNNCNILIQWETPKGDNGIIKGVSKEYVRDIESKPGKLIFGWALDKNITQTSGKLKFSVKFYELDEVEKEGKTVQVIVYSFNTLTANVTVHPSIGLNLEDKESYIVSENAAQNLLERLESSVIVGNAAAAQPVFLDFPYGEGGLDADGYDVDENGSLPLFVLAYAPDTGVISYDWRMRDLDLNNNSTNSIKTIKYDSELNYVPVTISELEAEYNDKNKDISDKTKHRIIYNKVDGKFNVIGSGLYVVENKTKYEDLALFESKGNIAVNKPGIYSVRAKNHIASSLSTVMSTDFGVDKTVILYRPEHIVMDNTNQTGDKHILNDINKSDTLSPVFNENAPGKLSYQWLKAKEVENDPVEAIASSKVILSGFPKSIAHNIEVTYGENTVNVLCKDKSFTGTQTAGAGSSPKTYYITCKVKAPDGAVSFVETQTSLATGKVIEREKIRLDAQSSGAADKTQYRYFWPGFAKKEDLESNEYFYYGKDERAGWIENLQWYDENDNLISIDEITINYLNENNYDPIYEYVEILSDEAKEKTFTPAEEGLYKLRITRERNNDAKVGYSMNYRVTEATAMPQLTTEPKNIKMALNNLTKFNIELDQAVKSDVYNITIMREHMVNDADKDFAVATIEGKLPESGKFEIHPNTFINAINKHNEDFKESLELDGLYYAIITNIRNGSKSAEALHTWSPDNELLSWTIYEV